MKVTCLQMDTALGNPEENYRQAEAAIRAAMAEKPDLIVLPELWDVGFFPKEHLEEVCDRNCARVTSFLSGLARELKVNIVGGSVANLRGGRIYNTARVFDRTGAVVAEYDKTHLFSPMGEHRYFTPGDHVCRFRLDGHDCGLVICYDIRFPELTRAMTVPGLELLIVVSQWPDIRIPHLRALTTARAIENQMYLVCCNGCGRAGDTRYGGHSAVIDPWGSTLALAGEEAGAITGDCDFSVTDSIRASIPVFADRRPELY